MAGTIVLTGRSKDTIVLSNGENIEPQPIEDACCASSYISNMIVVGQDKRTLGALVVPNKEAFEELEKIKGMDIIRALVQEHKVTSYHTVLLIRLTCYHCVDSMDWNKQCHFNFGGGLGLSVKLLHPCLCYYCQYGRPQNSAHNL